MPAESPTRATPYVFVNTGKPCRGCGVVLPYVSFLCEGDPREHLPICCPDPRQIPASLGTPVVAPSGLRVVFWKPWRPGDYDLVLDEGTVP